MTSKPHTTMRNDQHLLRLNPRGGLTSSCVSFLALSRSQHQSFQPRTNFSELGQTLRRLQRTETARALVDIHRRDYDLRQGLAVLVKLLPRHLNSLHLDHQRLQDVRHGPLDDDGTCVDRMVGGPYLDLEVVDGIRREGHGRTVCSSFLHNNIILTTWSS